MSLLDSLPVDRNLIRESLDDVNVDVLDEEEVVMRVRTTFDNSMKSFTQPFSNLGSK